jgi:putative transcriptional regulator
MKLGEIIKQKRQEKGLSQEGLAQLVRVSKNTISAWEAGRYRPSLYKMYALSRILKLTWPEICSAIRE